MATALRFAWRRFEDTKQWTFLMDTQYTLHYVPVLTKTIMLKTKLQFLSVAMKQMLFLLFSGYKDVFFLFYHVDTFYTHTYVTCHLFFKMNEESDFWIVMKF